MPIAPEQPQTQPLCCSLCFKALEDELNQKKREQEMFFKLSEEADGQMPVSPTKHAKFVPFSSSESL